MTHEAAIAAGKLARQISYLDDKIEDVEAMTEGTQVVMEILHMDKKWYERVGATLKEELLKSLREERDAYLKNLDAV